MSTCMAVPPQKPPHVPFALAQAFTPGLTAVDPIFQPDLLGFDGSKAAQALLEAPLTGLERCGRSRSQA